MEIRSEKTDGLGRRPHKVARAAGIKDSPELTSRSPRCRIRLSSSLISVSSVSSSPPECILIFIRRDFFLCTYWLAESARAWVSNIRWKIDKQWDCWTLCTIKIEGENRGGRRGNVCGHGLSRSWKVEVWMSEGAVPHACSLMVLARMWDAHLLCFRSLLVGTSVLRWR